MKKSLSLLLSFALVFGLFASMASAADTELTPAEKYQILKDKGVLKGTTTGSDELDRTLTRAEFATMAIALAGLAEEKPATATFSDVTSTQWWYGAIEAAAKAGFVEGSNGKFDPRGNVTVEQVVIIAARILDLEEVADATVEGASTWAAGYVQAAIDAGLIPATGLEYTADATRGQSISIGYTVYEEKNPVEPAKVSVAKAEATGIKQVTVTLDKAVDTEKATFTLKKGTVNVTLDKVTWSEDKKVATLPLKDVKVSAGEYTVTLGGLEADTVEKNSASFTAENEAVKTIEFVSSINEIAYTAKAKVKVAAKNQYGELASYPASYYTVFTGYTGMNERVTKNDAGELVIVLDTNVAGVIQNTTQIPLTIYFNETRLTATKTFKVGNAPFVTKMELGAVKYDGTKTSLTNAGEVATVPINLFDQYGNPITDDQLSTAINFNQFITPQPNKLTAVTDDFNNDEEYETKVTLGGKEAKSAAYTLTVYAGGTSATATIDVGNGKVATKVGFGDFDKVVAEGDTGFAYVPVIAFDVDGNQLTKDELVDDTNFARIKVSVSNSTTPVSIVRSGPNKGTVPVTAGSLIAKQVIFINASISEIDAQDYKSTTITIQEKRLPETLVVTGTSAPKAVLGADSEFTVKIRDQYGSDIDVPTGYSVAVSFADLSGTAGAAGISLLGRDDNTLNITAGTPTAPTTATYTNGDEFNDGFKFDTTSGVFGKVQFKAELLKGTTSLKTVSQEIESLDPTKVELTYALKSLGNLYAIGDTNYSVAGEAAEVSNLHKKVEIAVKDSAGNNVAFPDDKVAAVTVSNGQAVKVGNTGSVGSAVYYVLGNKAGESSVSATVYSAKGEIVHTSGTVSVKSDAVAVDSLTAGNGDKSYLDFASTTFDAYAAMDLKVVDNYGIEYKAGNIAKYNQLLGVTYSITNVKGTGTVTLNPANNQITVSGSVDEFVLTANTANGKSASTLVYDVK